MLPIAILSILAIYYIIERTLIIRKVGKSDSIWQSRIVELISENKIEQALKFCFEKPYILGKVIAAGLKEKEDTIAEIEETMEVEARQQVSKLENHMNYLGIIASIAPMLGFLGTIFGVINIFYNISQTADLDIATISDGLYQKMICSGAGLLVGIVAYAGYYVLNGNIDSRSEKHGWRRWRRWPRRRCVVAVAGFGGFGVCGRRRCGAARCRGLCIRRRRAGTGSRRNRFHASSRR